ncbi:MAG: sigma-54-dependent Fis family transcriptional regulator [Bdellovibrionales bacterium]|nr:sigma-54-dependent Fis family transcriptional regulator [Bdellovibrionales bacterium]
MATPSRNSRTILVVDDEESIREFLQIMLKREGWKVESAESAVKALRILEKQSFDAVISDISMPDMSGIELLTKIRQSKPNLPVIVITAFGSTESAVEAMKLGASDYLTKPFEVHELKLCLEEALKKTALERENSALQQELRKTFSFESIVGASRKMREVFELLQRIAPTKANVLILGESGTGKERVAGAIHHSSHRRAGPFVKVNCSALSEGLLESELFGHVKGAFTGAIRDKIGRFEQAAGGTLFLDEIGDLSPNVQVKLLRVLQEKEIERVGSGETRQVDTRVIAATHRDLQLALQQGFFRSDLYYRLNVMPLELPPLRARREDIPLLVEHFVAKLNHQHQRQVLKVDDGALSLMLDYDWPGNVRELENALEHAFIKCRGELLLAHHLPASLLATRPSGPAPGSPTAARPEKEQFLQVLAQCQWNRSAAASRLGMHRTTLWRKMRELGIPTRPDA